MNLFASELAAVLDRHSKAISALFTLTQPDGAPLVTPARVARLQRSLTQDISATLSERELNTIAERLALSADETRRLRAALLGEATRRLLVGRLSAMSALEEGERVMALLLDEEEEQQEARTHHEQMLTISGGMRAPAPRPTADTNAAIAEALEAAAEACERGELWLNMALGAPDRDTQSDLVSMARAALDRAAQTLAYAPPVAQGSAAQEEWRRCIEDAMATIRRLRPYA